MKTNLNNWFCPIIALSLLLTISCKKDKETDGIPDNYVYKTVTIGKQIWMAENLNASKYRNGDKLTMTTDYKNPGDDGSKVATYGRLYNVSVVDDPRNIAPVGWHVPTYAEWDTLITYLGGETIAGGKLKESGLAHWMTPNAGATNSSGFTALPAGTGGVIPGGDAYFFTSTPGGYGGYSRAIHLRYTEPTVYSNAAGDFYSIRCVKD